MKIALTTNRTFPEGYWPHGMDEAARKNSVHAFEAAIYPLWAGVEKNDAEAEEKMTSAQINAPGQIMLDCLTLHRQDIAIHTSGIKPHRENADQARMASIRRRDTRAASVSQERY